MKPRQITLPEPASKIWKHATTVVDALVEECKIKHLLFVVGHISLHSPTDCSTPPGRRRSAT